MKELPKVYANKIEKNIDNNKEMYDSRIEDNCRGIDVLKKIDRIFHSKDFVYKKRVIITLKEQELEAILIGRNESSIFTLDNKVIRISDVLDIKKKD